MANKKKIRNALQAPSQQFCVKLYCALPSLLEGIIEPDCDLCWETRKDIHDLANSIGKGVEYLGGMGSTCTWNVDSAVMNNLLLKIQNFNRSSSEMPCVIKIELY